MHAYIYMNANTCKKKFTYAHRSMSDLDEHVYESIIVHNRLMLVGG